MRSIQLTNMLLAAVAALLAANLLRSGSVAAQGDAARPVHIEPGTYMLRAPDGSRQVQGRVVVDLRNGSVWGFPTLADSPYPVDMTKPQPPVSEPFYLGRFHFAGMNR
jgi:hypothetical protein